MPKHYRHKTNIKLNLNLPFMQTCVCGSGFYSSTKF